MGLRRQAHLCMVPLLLALSGVSIAGTVSTVGMEATGMFDEGGITSCGYSSATTASCSVGANNYDPFGGELVTAGTSASSAFGALSGSIGAQAYQSCCYNFVSVQGGFTAEFNDPVVVTGGSGTGTLVADFSWTAEATVSGTSEAFWPTFAASVGTLSESWTGTANLPISPVCIAQVPVPCTGSGTLAVSSAFTFGGLIDVDGSTAVEMDTSEITGGSFPADLGQIGNSLSSLTVTFLVYDASGNLVPGAIVTPITSTPEPGSISLLLCGALVFGMRFARRSTSQNRPHHSAVHS